MTSLRTLIVTRIFFLGGIFLSPLVTLAAPSISGVSGTVSDGSSITISGSSFGTKSSAAPMVFDTFEAGTSGNQILTSPATVGAWETGSGYDSWLYTNTLAKAGSKSALWLATPASGNYNGSLSQNAPSIWTGGCASIIPVSHATISRGGSMERRIRSKPTP